MKLKRQAGQSTIEFIVCFAFGVTVILLVFNSAMNHISGYVAHYATFMTSRYYLTQEKFQADPMASVNGVDQDALASILPAYKLSVFGIPDGSTKIQPVSPGRGPGYAVLVGAYTKFEKRIDAIGKIAGQTSINFISESFLGKEPTRGECTQRVCKAIVNGPCDDSMDITIYDDGC